MQLKEKNNVHNKIKESTPDYSNDRLPEEIKPYERGSEDIVDIVEEEAQFYANEKDVVHLPEIDNKYKREKNTKNGH